MKKFQSAQFVFHVTNRRARRYAKYSPFRLATMLTGHRRSTYTYRTPQEKTQILAMRRAGGGGEFNRHKYNKEIKKHVFKGSKF